MNKSKEKKKLEQELVRKFIQNFYDKIGYQPLVILKHENSSNKATILTLNELDSYFIDLLPIQFNEKVKLSSKNRMAALVELRCIFVFIARSMGYTLKDIGVYLGGRDHTTILHNINVFRDLYETDDFFRNRYLTIINNIKNNNESSAMDYFDKTQD
jgi:hypothetical protein